MSRSTKKHLSAGKSTGYDVARIATNLRHIGKTTTRDANILGGTVFASRGMQPVCPAQVLRPKSSGGGCTARIITKRKNRAKNARRPYKYNAITLWASFVCHKVTGNRPVWESVRFASERSRVRIPSSPPQGGQANPAAIYFVGAVFVLAMPLPAKRR